MLQKTSHFMREANLIGGEWVQADSGQTIDVTNPATGLKLGTVPKSGKAETTAPSKRPRRLSRVSQDHGRRAVQDAARAA
jgi:acyl-CoA reductase-like NAD-dependent aldehyde dehydrogenase